MATQLTGGDRRDSIRMMSHEGVGVKASLRIGSKTIPVEILDASSGGYLLEADDHAIVAAAKAEQMVELIAASGRHPLRFVWQRRIGGKARMGLQRLHVEVPWRQESSWVIWMILAVILGLGLGAFFVFGDLTAGLLAS